MSKEQTKKSIEGLTKKEAIEELRLRIFLEKMADYADFNYIKICEEIIEELENE